MVRSLLVVTLVAFVSLGTACTVSAPPGGKGKSKAGKSKDGKGKKGKGGKSAKNKKGKKGSGSVASDGKGKGKGGKGKGKGGKAKGKSKGKGGAASAGCCEMHASGWYNLKVSRAQCDSNTGTWITGPKCDVVCCKKTPSAMAGGGPATKSTESRGDCDRKDPDYTGRIVHTGRCK